MNIEMGRNVDTDDGGVIQHYVKSPQMTISDHIGDNNHRPGCLYAQSRISFSVEKNFYPFTKFVI